MARPTRVCNKQGCVELVTGDTYCPEHKRPAWQGSTRNQHNPEGWTKLRATVMRRDRNTCTYCGNKATEVDHIIPLSRGGTHALTNLTAACTPCNQAKNIQERTTP